MDSVSVLQGGHQCLALASASALLCREEVGVRCRCKLVVAKQAGSCSKLFPLLHFALFDNYAVQCGGRCLRSAGSAFVVKMLEAAAAVPAFEHSSHQTAPRHFIPSKI